MHSNSSRPTPSAEDMEAAWRAVARRDWPPLHELAQAAARYELVLGTAARRARGERPAPAPEVQTPALLQPAPRNNQVPPGRNPTRPPSQAPLHPPIFDRKRAAAGERPDDE